jgi:predicted transposase/invertase (TIGR01784 family)
MKKNHLSPHDRYVRSIMSDQAVAREFLEAYLPKDVSKAIDLSTLEVQKDSFIDDKLKLQVADILYAVKFQESAGYIYVLIEHASTPDPLLPFRMLKYTLSIMDAHLKKTKDKKLPIVYPLILYSGSKPYNISTDFFDLFGSESDFARALFSKPYQLVDLGKISDETLKDLFWFGAAGLIAKHIKDPDILPVFKSAVSLFKNLEEVGHYDYIYVSLSYIMEAGEIRDREAFIETVKSHLESVDEDKIMTLADQWRHEGYQKGIHQGIEKGKLEGKKERDLEIARALLLKGMDLMTISSITDLSDTELMQLVS